MHQTQPRETTTLTEVMCRRCGFHQAPYKGTPSCPDCDNGLLRRVAPRVTPLSHLGKLAKAIFSLRGVLFLFFYAALTILPFWLLRWFGLGLLCMAAVKLAWKAMSATRRGIEFPELSPVEMLELRWIFPVGLFSLTFLIGPFILLGIAVASEQASWIIAAGALFAWSPLALAGYLRHGSVVGFVWPDTSWTLLKRDPFTLFLFVGVFLGVLFGGFTLNVALSSSFVGGALGSMVWAIALLFCFGLTGLLLRKHSRALFLELDDDEWRPIQVVTVSQEPAPAHFYPTYPTYPSNPSEPPVVVGTAIERPFAPTLRPLPIKPAPIEWEPNTGS